MTEATAIGGHDGMTVYRRPYGESSAITKVAFDAHNAEALEGERDLIVATGGPYAPRLIMESRHLGVEFGGLIEVTYEDLGDCQPVANGEVLRHHAIALLADLRSRGVRHGDLTGPRDDGVSNLIWDGARLRAVDWAEGHLLGDPAPQLKSPYSDSWLLMRTLAGWPDASGIADTPRVARRWKAVLEDLGADVYDPARPDPLRGHRFEDLGCYLGDFVALAACEGADAVGYDTGAFRPGQNSIADGAKGWTDLGVVESITNLGGKFRLVEWDLWGVSPSADVALSFSTWPYLVEQKGRRAATSWLHEAIDSTGILYFETQLAGDGPGPDFLPDNAAVHELLLGRGTPIASFPVEGRDAERTVWVVR